MFSRHRNAEFASLTLEDRVDPLDRRTIDRHRKLLAAQLNHLRSLRDLTRGGSVGTDCNYLTPWEKKASLQPFPVSSSFQMKFCKLEVDKTSAGSGPARYTWERAADFRTERESKLDSKPRYRAYVEPSRIPKTLVLCTRDDGNERFRLTEGEIVELLLDDTSGRTIGGSFRVQRIEFANGRWAANLWPKNDASHAEKAVRRLAPVQVKLKVNERQHDFWVDAAADVIAASPWPVDDFEHAEPCK